MAILQINGVDMPEPSSFKVGLQDLDSEKSTRNEAGRIQRDRIRQGVYKIDGEWRNISGTAVTKLENATSPSSFTARFTTASGTKTKVMYVGDRSEEMIRSAKGYVWNMSFNLVEV